MNKTNKNIANELMYRRFGALLFDADFAAYESFGSIGCITKRHDHGSFSISMQDESRHLLDIDIDPLHNKFCINALANLTVSMEIGFIHIDHIGQLEGRLSFDLSQITKVSICKGLSSVVLFKQLPSSSKELCIKVGADIDSIQDASRQVIESMQKYKISEVEKVKLGFVLDELLMNSLEHGVLGLTYHQKKELLENDMYDTVLLELIAKKQNSDKPIELTLSEYSNDAATLLWVVIKDNGNGFDITSFINNHYNTDIVSFNGRGIAMSKEECDGLFYNEVGNEVLILKQLYKES